MTDILLHNGQWIIYCTVAVCVECTCICIPLIDWTSMTAVSQSLSKACGHEKSVLNQLTDKDLHLIHDILLVCVCVCVCVCVLGDYIILLVCIQDLLQLICWSSV